VNVLEWNVVDNRDSQYRLSAYGPDSNVRPICYGADAVDCSAKDGEQRVTFFAYEWVNPRFGKKIEQITLRGSQKFIGSRSERISSNGVMWIALSAVLPRAVTDGS
jgi:hypothetical protein